MAATEINHAKNHHVLPATGPGCRFGVPVGRVGSQDVGGAVEGRRPGRPMNAVKDAVQVDG